MRRRDLAGPGWAMPRPRKTIAEKSLTWDRNAERVVEIARKAIADGKRDILRGR